MQKFEQVASGRSTLRTKLARVPNRWLEDLKLPESCSNVFTLPVLNMQRVCKGMFAALHVGNFGKHTWTYREACPAVCSQPAGPIRRSALRKLQVEAPPLCLESCTRKMYQRFRTLSVTKRNHTTIIFEFSHCFCRFPLFPRLGSLDLCCWFSLHSVSRRLHAVETT